MKTKTLSVCAILAIISVGTASAADLTLTCEMSNYQGAGARRVIDKLVPPHSIHVVEGSSTQVEGRKMLGQASDDGSVLTLKYHGPVKGLGEVDVVYTYFRSTNAVVAKTQARRFVTWDDYPERTGQFTIKGSCRQS